MLLVLRWLILAVFRALLILLLLLQVAFKCFTPRFHQFGVVECLPVLWIDLVCRAEGGFSFLPQFDTGLEVLSLEGCFSLLKDAVRHVVERVAL